jgi:hypothetical protein
VRCGILECYSTFSTQLRCCMYSRKGLRVYWNNQILKSIYTIY